MKRSVEVSCSVLSAWLLLRQKKFKEKMFPRHSHIMKCSQLKGTKMKHKNILICSIIAKISHFWQSLVRIGMTMTLGNLPLSLCEKVSWSVVFIAISLVFCAKSHSCFYLEKKMSVLVIAITLIWILFMIQGVRFLYRLLSSYKKLTIDPSS